MEKEKICNLDERNCFINQNINSLQDMNLYEGGCPLLIHGNETFGNFHMVTYPIVRYNNDFDNILNLTGIGYIYFNFPSYIQKSSLFIDNFGDDPITLTLLLGGMSGIGQDFEHPDYTNVLLPAHSKKYMNIDTLCFHMNLKCDSGIGQSSVRTELLYIMNNTY